MNGVVKWDPIELCYPHMGVCETRSNPFEVLPIISQRESARAEPNLTSLKFWTIFDHVAQIRNHPLGYFLVCGGLWMVSNFFGLEFSLVYVIPPGVTAKLYG